MDLETEDVPPPPTEIAVDRAVILVRAPIVAVFCALEPFARGGPVLDATASLGRGVGLDRLLPEGERRAVVYRPRGAHYVGIIREGEAAAAHDVPLARRLSRDLRAPALALHVSGGSAACELFHQGRSIESWLCYSGDVVHAASSFDLDEAALGRDPYGRALQLTASYGLADDRLAFADFASADALIRRWDVTIGCCYAYGDLAPWPEQALALAA